MKNPYQYTLSLVGGYSADRPLPERSHRRRLRGVDRCESPMELKLALALMATPGFVRRSQVDPPNRLGSWPGVGMRLLAQANYGRFRVDFALVSANRDETPYRCIVVEVDGHEWHERSKEQAEYDRARDRSIVANGASIFRFTGREVWRDADRCASEVFSIARRYMHSAD